MFSFPRLDRSDAMSNPDPRKQLYFETARRRDSKTREAVQPRTELTSGAMNMSYSRILTRKKIAPELWSVRLLRKERVRLGDASIVRIE